MVHSQSPHCGECGDSHCPVKCDRGQAASAWIGVIGALSHARLLPRNILPVEMKTVKELTKDEEMTVNECHFPSSQRKDKRGDGP